MRSCQEQYSGLWGKFQFQQGDRKERMGQLFLSMCQLLRSIARNRWEFILFPFASAGAYDGHIVQSFEEQGISCLK